jgi:hypothetical protein
MTVMIVAVMLLIVMIAAVLILVVVAVVVVVHLAMLAPRAGGCASGRRPISRRRGR